MHIPLLFRTRTSIADSPSALQSLLQRGLSKTSRCRLLMRMRSGQCYARTVRLFGWSPGANPHLWFVSSRQSQLAYCVRSGAEVMVEISDPKLPQPIRVAGHAKRVDSRHEPVYLHPSVRSTTMQIASDPLDFVFLQVELRPACEEHAFLNADSLAA
jgi:hypothetical protein